MNGAMIESSQKSDPSLARLQISPRHGRPFAICVHTSIQNSFECTPEFTIRWFFPRSSARE